MGDALTDAAPAPFVELLRLPEHEGLLDQRLTVVELLVRRMPEVLRDDLARGRQPLREVQDPLVLLGVSLRPPVVVVAVLPPPGPDELWRPAGTAELGVERIGAATVFLVALAVALAVVWTANEREWFVDSAGVSATLTPTRRASSL